MRNAETLDLLERERERERATFLKKSVASISVALIFQRILNMINVKNRDLCQGLRLLYLRL